MSELEDLRRRIDRLEAIDAIRQLVARYGYAADDRDINGIRNMFTEDGCFRAVNGQMEARGIDAVIDMYHARFRGMGHSFHVAHDHIIELQTETRATGRVTSHAELIRDGVPHVVALRYEDIYKCVDGTWCFKERAMAFYYYLKVSDYLTAMSGIERMQGIGIPIEADWPEKTPTYRAYKPIT